MITQGKFRDHNNKTHTHTLQTTMRNCHDLRSSIQVIFQTWVLQLLVYSNDVNVNFV